MNEKKCLIEKSNIIKYIGGINKVYISYFIYEDKRSIKPRRPR